VPDAGGRRAAAAVDAVHCFPAVSSAAAFHHATCRIRRLHNPRSTALHHAGRGASGVLRCFVCRVLCDAS